jgi:hypothetical protein
MAARVTRIGEWPLDSCAARCDADHRQRSRIVCTTQGLGSPGALPFSAGYRRNRACGLEGREIRCTVPYLSRVK